MLRWLKAAKRRIRLGVHARVAVREYQRVYFLPIIIPQQQEDPKSFCLNRMLD